MPRAFADENGTRWIVSEDFRYGFSNQRGADPTRSVLQFTDPGDRRLHLDVPRVDLSALSEDELIGLLSYALELERLRTANKQYRKFVDATGTIWIANIEGISGSGSQPGTVGLRFKSARQTRYLMPIDSLWDTMSEVELQRLLVRALPVREVKEKGGKGV